MMELEMAAPKGLTGPRLVLTGERLRRRHLVRVDDQPIWLPAAPFITLCRLACARCTTQTGYVVESPLTIFRLRGVIDGVAVQRSGLSVIETGDGHEYRLAIDRASIDVDPSFAELPSPTFINCDDKQTLLNR